MSLTSNELAQTVWTIIPASIVATIANVLFYYFATRVLQFELQVPSESGGHGPLPVFDVTLFSIIWAVVAGIVFLIVITFASNPIPIYVTISTIVLILSFGLPLMMPSDIVQGSTKGTLITMHVIGGVFVVGILVSLHRRQFSNKSFISG